MDWLMEKQQKTKTTIHEPDNKRSRTEEEGQRQRSIEIVANQLID
jgi:hypothetical protein